MNKSWQNYIHQKKGKRKKEKKASKSVVITVHLYATANTQMWLSVTNQSQRDTLLLAQFTVPSRTTFLRMSTSAPVAKVSMEEPPCYLIEKSIGMF